MRAALQRAIWRSRPRPSPGLLRRLHAQAVAAEVDELPPLSSLELDEPSPASFPLYHPPPPSYSPSRWREETIRGKQKAVPSDQKIQKALKAHLTADITDSVPELDEGELREFYKALIESGRPSSPSQHLQLEAPEKQLALSEGERKSVLDGLASRILPAAQELSDGEAESSIAALRQSQGTHRRVEKVLDALRSVAIDVHHQRSGGADVPLGFVSRTEWDALFEDAISTGNPRRAEEILALQEAHGQHSAESCLSDLITSYAESGFLEDVYRLEHHLQQRGQHLSSHQHNLIITHLLRFPSPSHAPAAAAIAHLKSYELTNPAPQSAYNLVLSHLFTSTPSSHTRALGWDLFAHMRLTAHPSPSREVYASMIAGCASTAEPRPEQARDLWTEMTVDQGIVPEEPEYTAIIRALGSTKRDYLEAFDLFRQMLARHHEATYSPFGEPDVAFDTRWIPRLATWKALLEGTKRAGDLGRARWVLAECVKLHAASRGGAAKMEGPDEEMMGSVFMSYAAWKPVVRRGQVKERDSNCAKAASGAVAAVESDSAETSVEATQGGEVASPPRSSESVQEPQTSADAIREANALFSQLQSSTTDDSHSPWVNVKMTSRLLNSFLSVHFAHSPSLEVARDTWNSTWVESNVDPNGWSYMQALERCAQSNRATGTSTDRKVALEWGKELWQSYLAFSVRPPVTPQDAYHLGLNARQVERTWRAIIRLHALSEDLPAALKLLDDFHSRYPPSDILQGYFPAADPGLQIRFSDPTMTLEPDVPPHLLFPDVDVLHQRLVRDEEWKKVGHVKWVVMNYEKALERRRKWRLKGVGKGREARRAKEILLALQRESVGVLGEQGVPGLRVAEK